MQYESAKSFARLPLVRKIPKTYKVRYKGYAPGYCHVCLEPSSEYHHLLHGSVVNRTFSDYYGLVVKVCRRCHDFIHKNGTLDYKYRALGQHMFEKQFSQQDFKDHFGKYYYHGDYRDFKLGDYYVRNSEITGNF